MVRVYLDNSVVSEITRRQASDQELQAIDKLVELQQAAKIVVGTSRQTHREMERAPTKHQSDLKAGLHGLEVAADDHRVLGSFTLSDPYGGSICNPMVTDIVDESLHSQLLAAGLKPDDAKHFMYAAQDGYEWFVALDRNFLSRQAVLQKLCPSIKVGKPSECLAALSKTCGPM